MMEYYVLYKDGRVEITKGANRKKVSARFNDSEVRVLTKADMKCAKNIYRMYNGLEALGFAEPFSQEYIRNCKINPKYMLALCALPGKEKKPFATALMKYLQDNAGEILGGTI